uniref:Protein of unassigned function n=1 Tax=Methylobacterium oryzae CBMB20 TaxID=693986 RepID=A0A088B337_9HYPH|nr:hypothetical protein [Methylobacterium oryzae]AGO88254.1 protein of unassigned function [Methylobacterium oryzae CBMB20]
MTVNAHAGIAYPTADAAFLAMIADWTCAGGYNSSAEVAAWFAARTDASLADEFITDRAPDAEPLDRDDIIAAFAKLRAMSDPSDAL